MSLNLTNSSLENNGPQEKTLIKYYLILEELFLHFERVAILKFALSQSEAVSTVLISCEIKSMSSYGYNIISRIWVRETPNRTILARFGGILGFFRITILVIVRSFKDEKNRFRETGKSNQFYNITQISRTHSTFYWLKRS